ncbi:hypothetical protein GCM10020000_20330 [Streptomyces olivoverticillatus]
MGDFLRFYRSPWARSEPRATQLVMIGNGIDAQALSEGLDACRWGHLPAEAGEGPQDADSMWGVLRYAQS